MGWMALGFFPAHQHTSSSDLRPFHSYISTRRESSNTESARDVDGSTYKIAHPRHTSDFFYFYLSLPFFPNFFARSFLLFNVRAFHEFPY